MAPPLSQHVSRILMAADEEAGWVQLLIFIIVAVIYGLAGIARARANKASKQAPPGSPKPNPAEPGRRLSASPPAKPPQPSLAPAPVRVLPFQSPQPNQPTRTRAKKPPIPKTNPPQFPRVQSNLLKKPKHRTEQPQQTQLALDFADPSALQRAIIHYEVLGPCLALRPETRLIPSAPAKSTFEPSAGQKET